VKKPCKNWGRCDDIAPELIEKMRKFVSRCAFKRPSNPNPELTDYLRSLYD